MFFRKLRGRDKASRPLASFPYERVTPTHRCVVESLDCLRVTGWAVSVHHEPVRIELRCGDQTLVADLHRISRPDVSVHLGADPEGLPLGFQLDLPATIWDHATEDGWVDCHLQLDGNDHDMPAMRLTRDRLDTWPAQLFALAEAETQRAEWARAAPHFRRCFEPAQWQQLSQQWDDVEARRAPAEPPPFMRFDETGPGIKPPQEVRGNGVYCVIESLAALSVSGWAVSAFDQPVQIELSCQGHLLAAEVRRVARPDVLAHLDLAPGTAPLGFQLDLPSAIWDNATQEGWVDCQLWLDGLVSGLPPMRASRDQLDAWPDQLFALADVEAQRAEWARAAPHFRRCLEPARWQQVHHQWEAAEAERIARAQRPGGRLKWAIEQQQGLSITGWAADPDNLDQIFAMTCNGQTLPVSVVRFERADVREQLGAVRLDSGFELALPATMWAAIPDGQAGEIQVQLGDRPLLVPPRSFSREWLLREVEQWHAQTDDSALEAAHHADRQVAGERRYRTLLLLEHVIAAGIGPRLPAAHATRLRVLADAHGLDGNWPTPAFANESTTQALLNEAIWRLQRRFNAALDPARGGAGMMAALDDALEGAADSHLDAIARRRFLVSMVPFFCAHDDLASLRPRLDTDELSTLTLAHGRWELSLLLPVTVFDELASGTGRLAGSASLMERVAAASDPGWLNSAAVLDALRRLARHPGALDDTEMDRVIDAACRLLEGLGDLHDSRLYDDHLVHAACSLLQLTTRSGETAEQRAAETVLRHLGLTPAFWQALQLAWPDNTSWPSPLVRGHRLFQRLQDLWPALAQGDPDAEPVCAAALRGLRELGCLDADSLQRHVLLIAAEHSAAPLPGQTPKVLRGLPAEDMLRWMGRCPVLPSLMTASERSALWQLASPVPVVASLALRQQAARTLEALVRAVSEGDAVAAAVAAPVAWQAGLALAGERNGFLGLRHLAACLAWIGRAGVGIDKPAGPSMHGLLEAVHRALSACERHRDRHPVPAAALVAALTWIGRATEPQAVPEVSAFLMSCAARLRVQWHDDAEAALLPLPPAPTLPVSVPGVATLVVVRCRETGDPAQLARILQGWGVRLEEDGSRLAIWRRQPAAVTAVAATLVPLERRAAPGTPEVLAETLGGLLAWLIEHSDFGQLLLLDDDAELDVEAWRWACGAPAHHYHGLAGQAPSRQPGQPLDKSPAGTRFAAIAQGLTLSRYAVQRMLALRQTAHGARLSRSSFHEDKWLGDLMALAGIPLSEEGQAVHQQRPPRPGFTPRAFHNLYLPSPDSPIVLTHAAPARGDSARPGQFWPRRVWPTDQVARLANDGSALQLVELSEPDKADALRGADCLVVAVARNERVLMPHFLAHYRHLGIRHFVLVDNLSDDGTREYLLAQDDVVLYSADAPYSQSRYGVAWQQAVLATHGNGRWAVLADIDEFLVWPGCEAESLPQLCRRLAEQGAQAARVLMIDMYPEGALEDADFGSTSPFEAAPCFDAQAVLPWRLGSGSYSNGPSWVSGLRHRLMPDSAPNHYTSQKIALMRHQPWVRCSAGLHYAAGLDVSGEMLAFAHFKYHSGFRAKVLAEVARKQHYNGAEEYRQYQELLAETRTSFFDPALSRRYENSRSFAGLLT